LHNIGMLSQDLHHKDLPHPALQNIGLLCLNLLFVN